jgi:hypothetical protein
MHYSGLRPASKLNLLRPQHKSNHPTNAGVKQLYRVCAATPPRMSAAVLDTIHGNAQLESDLVDEAISWASQHGLVRKVPQPSIYQVPFC